MALKGKGMPPELLGSKGIGSHLTWIEDNIPYKERVALRDSKTMAGYIRTLLKAEYEEDMIHAGLLEIEKEMGGNSNLEDEESEEEELDDVQKEAKISSAIGSLAAHLNIAAMYGYISVFDGAAWHLDKARELLKDLRTDHQDIGQYFVEALQYSIAVIRKTDQEVDDKDFSSADQKLQLNHKPTQAVIAFLQGHLGLVMNVQDKEVLKRFSKAAELEPDFYLWHHYAFYHSRTIRRYERFQNQTEKVPSTDEEYYCKTAYKLRPEGDYLTILDYALLLKESMWGKPWQLWEEDKVALSIKLFKEALERAKARKSEEMVMWIKVYLADLLVFGKSQCLEYKQEGKELLDECVKDYPTSSTVFHKAGKLYWNGLRGSHLYQDIGLGKAYLERGLVCCSRNFPCLMDYIHLLKYLDKMDDVIRTIDNYLKLLFRDFQIGKLHILRGCAVWQYNPFSNPHYKTEASDSWMLVLRTYPTMADELYATVKQMFGDDNAKKYRHHKFLSYQDRLGLIEHLKSRAQEFEGDKAKKLQAFIDALKPEKKDDGLDWSSIRSRRSEVNSNLDGEFSRLSLFQNPRTSSTPAENGNFNANVGGYRRPQQGFERNQLPQNTAWKRQPRNESVADDDGNWRKKQ